MIKKQISVDNWLQTAVLRVTRVHFCAIAAFALIVVLSDAWNLSARELVWQRWVCTALMLAATTAVWYIARANKAGVAYYRSLLWAIVIIDIAFATFVVYTERGMASRGVMLYSLPIVVSAVLLNRSALFGTAALCMASYVLAATRYFFVYFNEGYKAELYITLGLYCAMFFVLAGLLWVVLRAKVDP